MDSKRKPAMPMAIQIERGRSIVGFAGKAESGCGRLEGGGFRMWMPRSALRRLICRFFSLSFENGDDWSLI